MDHALGHTPHQEPIHPRAAVGTHHNRLGTDILGVGGDRLTGGTLPNTNDRVDPLGVRHVGDLVGDPFAFLLECPFDVVAAELWGHLAHALVVNDIKDVHVGIVFVRQIDRMGCGFGRRLTAVSREQHRLVHVSTFLSAVVN